jgi:hypothetical protein
MILSGGAGFSLWEKCFFIVIPSAARDLLLRKSQEKADSSGNIRPRNDRIGVFPQPVQPRDFGWCERQKLPETFATKLKWKPAFRFIEKRKSQ